ncbi:hypothetical protein VNO80_11654 [Phaseolus coccineus]|uniref:Acyl carrier protein n=1 Tax=Phaseolus coccineus TaxID=3886 RepID=A0AAN9NAT9_PHACN
MLVDFWIESYIERGTSTTHSLCSVISSTIAQKTWFYFPTKQCEIQHSHFINPNPISYHSPLSAPKTLPSITMAMTSLSATSLSFQPSLNFSTPITQGCYKTSSLGAVCVGWDRRSFPSLRSSRFRICAVQAEPETVQKVCDIVRKQLVLAPESELTPDTKFSDLGADSLDTVEIVMAFEEEFDINVEEDGSQNISTVQEAADLIQKLVQEKKVDQEKTVDKEKKVDQDNVTESA